MITEDKIKRNILEAASTVDEIRENMLRWTLTCFNASRNKDSGIGKGKRA